MSLPRVALFVVCLAFTFSCGVDRTETIPKLTGDAAAGKALYESTAKPSSCAGCHGATGVGDAKFKYPDLREPSKNKSVAQLSKSILEGGGAMAAYGATMTDQQIADVIAHMKATFGQ